MKGDITLVCYELRNYEKSVKKLFQNIRQTNMKEDTKTKIVFLFFGEFF